MPKVLHTDPKSIIFTKGERNVCENHTKRFLTVGFDQSGELKSHELAIVMAEVPGPRGEWCYVVKEGKFCWIKGLEQGKGFLVYEYPLNGPQNDWQQQIERYCEIGPKEGDRHTAVHPDVEMALEQDRFFIIAK